MTEDDPNRDARSTIIDVAEAAGVSRQTVTRAMNGMDGISAATKARVLEVAAALDYRPSRFGRGLVTGGDRQLGLVVRDLRNPYSPELAAAVLGAAAGAGWNVMLADVALAGDSDRTVAALGAQTDAVVGALGGDAGEWIDRLGPVPVVELDPYGEPTRAAVRLDPSAAIDDLVAHLTSVGVRGPVVLDSPSAGRPTERARLALEAFAARGITARLVDLTADTAEAGAEAISALLRAGERPDAILGFNDVVALGVLSACRRAGLEVPGDVRVSGIDGLPLGGLVAPTLTTLAVDLAEVAGHALDLATGMLAGTLPRSGPEVQRTVRHRLVLRESA